MLRIEGATLPPEAVGQYVPLEGTLRFGEWKNPEALYDAVANARQSTTVVFEETV